MTNDKKLEWALRIGVAGEFFGHGLLAIEGKKEWVGWIGQLVHLSAPAATTVLLLVGISDVIISLIVLIKPPRWILLVAAFWGFWTALIRPIVGVGWLDFIERFANWGAPLALYFFYRNKRK